MNKPEAVHSNRRYIMNNAREAVIVAYGRTPMARAFKGGFVETHPVEYAAQALKGVLGGVASNGSGPSA